MKELEEIYAVDDKLEPCVLNIKEKLWSGGPEELLLKLQ